MDLGTFVSIGIIIVGIISALVGVIWRLLNNKIQTIGTSIISLEKDNNADHKEILMEVKENFVRKELYNTEIQALTNSLREIKEEMKQTMLLSQQINQDVTFIKGRIDEILSSK